MGLTFKLQTLATAKEKSTVVKNIIHHQVNTSDSNSFTGGYVITWKETPDGKHYIVTETINYWQGSRSGERRRLDLDSEAVKLLQKKPNEDEPSLDVTLEKFGYECANDGDLIEAGTIVR